MRAVFLGTPSAAVPSLAALADVAEVAGVVTRPDRRRGRGRGSVAAPPMKTAAIEWGFRVFQPVGAEALGDILRELHPDVALLVAYGMLLPPSVLALVPLGFVNVHFSLLPRWRGAAPVERAILEGDASTGVSLMVLDEGLDTGPVLAALETPIAPDETGGSLTARLAFLGAKLVDDVVPDYLNGRRRPAEQLGVGASVARRLTPEEARIDGGWAVERAERAIRAFHPRPGAWVELDDGRLGIRRARPADAEVEPGRIAAVDGVPVAGFRGGALEFVTVRPEGRREMTGREWLNGRRGRGAVMVPSRA